MAKQNDKISRQKQRMRKEAYFWYERLTKLCFGPKFYRFGSHGFEVFYRVYFEMGSKFFSHTMRFLRNSVTNKSTIIKTNETRIKPLNFSVGKE